MSSSAHAAPALFPAPSAIAELLKPVTWFPPMWAFSCGVIASGLPLAGHWMLIIVGVLLSGPLVCATSQAVNDWFDRHVDAINEPQRPIPSGRMPGRWGLYVAVIWTLLSLAVATLLGPWGFGAAVVGLLLAWAYSAPPLRLKRNGWWGCLACGICYEGLAWVTGGVVMAGGAAPAAASLLLAALYSAGAHGIMTLNDFKAIEGDRQMGIGSLPVRLGVPGAARVACLFMALPQFVVIGLLLHWGQPLHAAGVAALLVGQGLMMRRFLRDPVRQALWYSGFGVPLFVSGMMVSAFALRGPGRGHGLNGLPALGWLGIARLGLVQAMLGAVVVLTTSTLNRVMVVELALPALLPGLLVALHYAVQLSRPRMGYGSDVGGRRAPWILGGMAVLALGGFGAAVATTWMNDARGPGIALAALSFAMVGVGVSAGGTSLLVLLAKRVDAQRRASAAALVWVMMIVGFAVTAGLAGRFLDPYSPARLMAVSGVVSLVAVAVSMLALWGLEGPGRAAPEAPKARPDFVAALREVWGEPDARRFTVFVFVSMLAYSTQDLILEPFAGAVFGYTPGASTQLAGVQHGGTLMGMLLAALAGRRVAGARLGSLRAWMVGGCIASGLALLGLVVAGALAPHWPLRANVFVLGVANGAFSIAAIGSMMSLAGGASHSGHAREGTRMGLWGAAQAIGFAVGGLFGAAASDVARWLIGDMGSAYAAVFALEAAMFVAAALLAHRIGGPLLAAPPPKRPASAAPLVGPADTQALRAGGS